jgi:hypothetical protein
VLAVDAPANVTIDGELGEWGDLRPIRREPAVVASHHRRLWPPLTGTRATKAASTGAGSAIGDRPVLPNRLVGDPSRVAVAVTTEAVWVVGELEDTSAEAVWLGLGVDPPEVADIGWGTRGAASAEPAPCEELARRRCVELGCNGEERHEELELERCRDARVHHAEFVRRHEKRFHKLVRIEQRAAFEHEPRREAGGQPIERALGGTEIAWTRGEDRVRFEARLPLDALPRLGEAPLRSLNLYARTTRRGASVDEAIATMPAAAWWQSWLPRPVSFEPHAELRHALFAVAFEQHAPASTPAGSVLGHPAPGLSYHPSTPNEIEVVESGHERAERLVGPLFRRVARLGPIDVGRARAMHDYLVVLSPKGLVALVDLEGAGPSKAVERAGELHVATPVLVPGRGSPGITLPHWSVVAVAPDGTLRDPIEALGREARLPDCARFENARLLPEQKLERFGIRGECTDARDGKVRTIELEVRWNARRRAYEGNEWQAPPGR